MPFCTHSGVAVLWVVMRILDSQLGGTHSPQWLDSVEPSPLEPPAGCIHPLTSPDRLFSLSMPSSPTFVEQTWVLSIPTLHSSHSDCNSRVHPRRPCPRGEETLAFTLRFRELGLTPRASFSIQGWNPGDDPLPGSALGRPLPPRTAYPYGHLFWFPRDGSHRILPLEARSIVRWNPKEVGSVRNGRDASPRHDNHLDQFEDEAALPKCADEKDVRRRTMGCTTSRDTVDIGNAAYKTKASAEGKDRAGHAGLQRSSSNMHIGNTDTLSVEASSSGYSANKPFEDAHVIVGSSGSAHMPPHVFSAVLDGHGGHHTAEFVKGRIYETFVQRMAKNGNDVKEAFVWSFQTIDAQFLSQAAKDQHMLTCGACVCAVYIDLNSAKLWVANLGDVRCVLGGCGETSMREGGYIRECRLEQQVGRAITKDHNAKYESERKKHLRGVKEEHRKDVFRVRDGVWRVKGVLQVTRAVGDGICKEKRLAMTFNRSASPDYRILPLPGDGGRPPYVSNVAEVHMVELTPNDTHIIIASDGLWDELGNTEAAMRCMCYDSFRSQPLGRRPSMTPSPIQHVPSFVSLTKQPGNMSADLVFYALWKVVKRVDPVSATLQNLVSVPQLDTMHMLDAYSILLSRKAFHDDITAVVLKLNWPEEDPSPQIVLPRGIKPASELRVNSPSGKRHWEALRFLAAFHIAYHRFLRRQWYEWIALATENKVCEPMDGLLSSAPAQ